MEQSILDQLNKRRQRAYLSVCALYAVEFLFLLGLIELLSRSEVGSMFAGMLFWFSIPMFVLTYFYVQPIIIKSYRIAYKNTVIPYLMGKFSDSIQYEPEGGINENTIDALSLFNIMTYKTEDLLSGTINDIQFKCADLKITGPGKNNQQFYGQWYIFDFNKHFKGITHIIENNKNPLEATVGEMSSFRKPIGHESINLNRIKTANKEFNNHFKVYTSDHHHAMYIMTPHFIEKIMKLEKRYYGRLFLSFYKNKVHIGIHNAKNYLEPSLLEDITDEQFKEHIENLKTIQAIIEELKLNIKLYFE